MRFHSNGPIIPDLLLERCDAGRVVFLCGAGVSLPSGMPSFVGLTKYVIDFFDPPKDSEVMRAFQPWLDDPDGTNMPLDQIFNLLHIEYGKDEINALVTERLQDSFNGEQVGYHHDLIKRISSSPNGNPQVVTTNFDLLFELGQKSAVHVPPAFPDIAFGNSVEGITYLHGRLADVGAEHHPYVLSSSDFGRAYLSEAWATNFIRNLLARYTVVLVGYQAEDPPIKYLLQGLNHDGQYNQSRLFAFDKGRAEDIEAKWRDRGVAAIAYEDHSCLWQTIEAWADRADDPREWRISIISKTHQDPKVLQAYERGQVAHVVKTVAGAKLFAEAEPPADPEWICVMDDSIRSTEKIKGYSEESDSFDPIEAYGLDDDHKKITDAEMRRGVRNENLLQWRDGDENSSEGHRLSGRSPENLLRMPPRLWHLTRWIAANFTSPKIAWWMIRQPELHPRLLHEIEWQLDRAKNLPDIVKQVWNLVIERHKQPLRNEWDGGWFRLKERVATDGWSHSAIRNFQLVCSPKIQIKAPFGLRAACPPETDWPNISFNDLGQFEVKFLDCHNDELEVPDDALPKVFDTVEAAMTAASGLLLDIGERYFNIPTCYPDREIDGKERYPDAAEFTTLFIRLFDRLVELSPNIALGHCLTWPQSDTYFFKKLNLYALSKGSLFNSAEVAERLLKLNRDTFWDEDVARELLFLLVDRWDEFSDDQKSKLGKRLLAGPDKKSYWSSDEYPDIKNTIAARYTRYVQMQGVALNDDQTSQLEEIISGIDSWDDGWASSTVTLRGTSFGWVGTDETPDPVMELPVDEIIAKAKGDSERDFGSFTEKRPFTGLVKANPRKALAALSREAKNRSYPQAFWSVIIRDMPADIPPRLRLVFLNRLASLPYAVVGELRHPICQWLKENLVTVLEFDEKLGWMVFDHILDGIAACGACAVKSAMGNVEKNGEIVPLSRRTYDHAINGPIGHCTEALLLAVPRDEQTERSLIPKHIKSRIERLFTIQGEGSDHAVTIVLSRLNWLMFIDPDWVEDRLVPMLAFEHPVAEPAWNGFLHSGRNPCSAIAILIRELLPYLVPWVEAQSWDRDLANTASTWIGWIYIFRAGEKEGISKKEMRQILRSMTDDTRNQFIYWLGKVGESNENGWKNLVIPFLVKVWPRERKYRTARSVESWIGLLDDSKDGFPDLYRAVKTFLVPVETERHPFYRFIRGSDGEDPISERFPAETLDLINTVTPAALDRTPYELPKMLSLIAEAAPELQSDHRYLRLIDLVERS